MVGAVCPWWGCVYFVCGQGVCMAGSVSRVCNVVVAGVVCGCIECSMCMKRGARQPWQVGSVWQ